MSDGSLIRRVALTVIAVACIGGGSFALAVAGGHLHIANARPSLRVKASLATLPIVGFAPGDSAQRIALVQNRGKKTIRRIRFELAEKSTVTARGRIVAAPAGATTPDGAHWVRTCATVIKKHKKIRRCRTRLRPAPSPLVADPTGLQVTVERCSKPWIQLPGPAPSYACRKRMTVVVAPTKVPARMFLKGIPKLKPGAKLYLRMTITLPANAANQLQGRSATLVPTFVIPGGRR